MSHTPEPDDYVSVCPVCTQLLRQFDSPEVNQHITKNYNGCAGLNPAAYRQVVEAVKAALTWQIKPNGGLSEIIGHPEWVAQAQQALAHAEAQP